MDIDDNVEADHDMKNGQLPKIDVQVKRPPVLFTKTRHLIAPLSRQLGGPVVAYWNGASGSVWRIQRGALQVA